MEDPSFFCLTEDQPQTVLDMLKDQGAISGLSDIFDVVAKAIAKKTVIWTRADTVVKETSGPLFLGVGFFDGSAELHRHVLKLAAEWTVPEGANVRFYPQEDVTKADIRVTFASGFNQSALGNRARHDHAANAPTMHLADAMLNAFNAPTARMKSVVRHEFGHALGLSHEHTHFAAPFDFDEDKILADHIGKPWGKCQQGEEACRESIRRFITTRLTAAATEHTPAYDETSIMAYPVKDHWLKSGTGAEENQTISARDLAFVKSLYP